jgi:hypothetical protein
MEALAQDVLPTSTAGLSDEAARHLHLAGLAYSCDALAERHLEQALMLAPEHLAVHVGIYRYLFYKGRLQESLGQLGVCFGKLEAQSGIPADWRAVETEHADFGSWDALWPRFYLFALKAHAYLSLRLGQLEEGREAVLKSLELDPTDKVGAKVLLDVLNRIGRDEYDE